MVEITISLSYKDFFIVLIALNRESFISLIILTFFPKVGEEYFSFNKRATGVYFF